MKVKDLIQHLQAFEPDADVKIRISAPDDVEMTDGDILEITDSRSFAIGYGGDLHIIGDMQE